MVRTIPFATTLLLTTCAMLPAQNRAVPESRAYGQLKILSPLIGKFSEEITQGNGDRVELEYDTSWSFRKRMLVTVVRIRQNGKEWADSAIRQYFYWNTQDERIEHLQVMPRFGAASTYEVKARKDNSFSLKRLNANRSNGMTSATWTVSSEGIARKETTLNGAGLPRQVRKTLHRIK